MESIVPFTDPVNKCKALPAGTFWSGGQETDWHMEMSAQSHTESDNCFVEYAAGQQHSVHRRSAAQAAETPRFCGCNLSGSLFSQD